MIVLLIYIISIHVVVTLVADCFRILVKLAHSIKTTLINADADYK